MSVIVLAEYQLTESQALLQSATKFVPHFPHFLPDFD
jgi:hypothetical protein